MKFKKPIIYKPLNYTRIDLGLSTLPLHFCDHQRIYIWRDASPQNAYNKLRLE